MLDIYMFFFPRELANALVSICLFFFAGADTCFGINMFFQRELSNALVSICFFRGICHKCFGIHILWLMNPWT
jgi:hypothetical protein